MIPFKGYVFLVIILLFSSSMSFAKEKKVNNQSSKRPNIIFIFADDLREDTLGINKKMLHTPNIDRLAKSGIVFNEAYSVLAVCSPSRATILTGRYPSVHGVTTYGDKPINKGLPSFVTKLNEAGYMTGVTGKWHLGNTPEEMGFTDADIFKANGAWYGREVIENGEKKVYPGFIEEWSVDRSINFIDKATESGKPFFLWYNTQVPHMDHNFSWPASKQSLSKYKIESMPLPLSYPPENQTTGKPPYLQLSRSYTRAMQVYGYSEPKKLKKHIRDYYAAVTDMDREVGRLLAEIKNRGLKQNTYVIFMSDNGWLLGEHGLTSKVLAYQPSMKVPLFISGPNITSRDSDEIVSNLDIAPYILSLAKVKPDFHLDGESLEKLLNNPLSEWRDYLYYESPTPQLVPRSFFAIRDSNYVYIETYLNKSVTKPEFIELYSTNEKTGELVNLALSANYSKLLEEYAEQLQEARRHYSGGNN